VRPARAEGELRRSRGFACDGLAVALNNGALLLAIDLFEPVRLRLLNSAVALSQLGSWERPSANGS
jgi:hypothetical protein